MALPSQSSFIAFDTTAQSASVALFREGKFFAEKTSPSPRAHAEFITVAISELIKESGLEFSDLKILVTALGPGSFTGVRVGISVAKSLAYSLSIPIWACDTLTLWRAQENEERRVFVVLNAFNDLFYVGIFGPVERKCQPRVMSLPDLIAEMSATGSHFTVMGNAQHLLNGLPANAQLKLLESPPTALGLGNLYLRHAQVGQTYDWKNVIPLYLRASTADEPRV